METKWYHGVKWTFPEVCLDGKIPIKGGVTAWGKAYNVAWVNRPDSAKVGDDKLHAELIAAAPETATQRDSLLSVQKQLVEALEGCERDITIRIRHGLALEGWAAQEISDLVDACPAIISARAAILAAKASS